MEKKRQGNAGSGMLYTQHAEYKMREYKVSRQRVSSVVRRPDRLETGIAPKTVAAMQITGSKKHPHELWVMYQRNIKYQNGKSNTEKEKMQSVASIGVGVMRIISVWRYPGKSPERDPIPAHILEEMVTFISVK